MTYSLDLRERALKLVESGCSQVEACRILGIGRKTLYLWLHREDLSFRPAKERHRKLDKGALAAHVREHPDAYISERAAVFGVHESSISRALKKLKILKKNDEIFREKLY